MRIPRFGIFILALSLCLTSALRSERSDAVLPAIAAYATLEVIVIGTGLAAAAGIITMQQNRAFQSQVQALSRRLSEATGDAIESISGQVKELYKNYTGATKKAGAKAKPTSPAKDADCTAGINDDPRKCCDNWFKRAENIENAKSTGSLLAQTAKKAWQIFRYGTSEVRCCIEWDSTHARFEVFTPGGDGRYVKGPGDAYTHKGEFSCIGNSEDPCKATHPGKADNSGEHAPRDGCKEGLRVRQSGEARPAEATR